MFSGCLETLTKCIIFVSVSQPILLHPSPEHETEISAFVQKVGGTRVAALRALVEDGIKYRKLDALAHSKAFLRDAGFITDHPTTINEHPEQTH